MSDNTNVITSLDGKQTIRINTPSATVTDMGDANNVYMTVNVNGEDKQVVGVYALGLDGNVVDVRAANKDLGWDLDNFFIHLKGDPNAPVDGDFRFFWDGTDVRPQEYQGSTMTWVATGMVLSGGTVRVGLQAGLADFGSAAGFTILRDPGVGYIPPATGVSKGGMTFPAGTPTPLGSAVKTTSVDGTDDIDAVWDGSIYKLTASETVPAFFSGYRQYLTVGDTHPTSTVTFRMWETTANDPNKILIEKFLSPDLWDGKISGDEIVFNFSETGNEEYPVGVRLGETYYFEYSSENPFSLYGDGADMNRSADTQEVEFKFLTLDNFKITDSDVTHDMSAIYAVDTTSAPVTVTVPFFQGVVPTSNSFVVMDTKSTFHTNNCIVEILDPVGGLAYTVTLDKKYSMVQIYPSGIPGSWYYKEMGKGIAVLIDGDKTQSVDFLISTNYMRAYLSNDLTIDTAEKTIPFDTVENSEGITNSAGEFTVRDTGLYSGNLSVYVDQTGQPSVDFWMEYKLAGGAWTLAPNSLFKTKSFSDASNSISVTASMELPAGSSVRVKIERIGTLASLKGQSLSTDLGTVYQRSAKISFSRINSN